MFISNTPTLLPCGSCLWTSLSVSITLLSLPACAPPWHHPHCTISTSQQSDLLPYLMKHPQSLSPPRPQSMPHLPTTTMHIRTFLKTKPCCSYTCLVPWCTTELCTTQGRFFSQKEIFLSAYKAATKTLSKTKMLCCFPHLSRSTKAPKLPPGLPSRDTTRCDKFFLQENSTSMHSALPLLLSCGPSHAHHFMSSHPNINLHVYSLGYHHFCCISVQFIAQSF